MPTFTFEIDNGLEIGITAWTIKEAIERLRTQEMIKTFTYIGRKKTDIRKEEIKS